MESFIKILIIIHAAFGSIALITGLISIIAFKGKNLHKKSGKLFVYTMIASGVTAMFVAVMPKHENAFLFSNGIFSTYLVLTGYRALRFKKKEVNLKIDIALAWVMATTGFLMIALPAILTQKFNIVSGVFGIIGISLAIQDLSLFVNMDRLRKGWLKLHIGKIIGGYISAITAFIVVNQLIPGIYGWLIPAVVGSTYIGYWMRKIRLGEKTSSSLKMTGTIKLMIILLFISTGSYSQVYTEKQTRHRFAQMTMGIDFEASFGGSTEFLDENNYLKTINLKNTYKPRFIIGGTHFWGHADFAIAIPLLYPKMEKENQTIRYFKGVETMFKYYPWRIQHNKIRPFLGVSIAPFYYEQTNKNSNFGNGPELNHTNLPLLGGVTFNSKNTLLELGIAWNHSNNQDYYISRTESRNIKTQPLFLNFSFKYMLETTISAEKDWESGRTQEITEKLANKKRLDGFYIGAGLSSAWWLGKSSYNVAKRPYIGLYDTSLMPDFALGYYMNNSDINIALGYRRVRTATSAYGAIQVLSRKSIVFEATKFLFDYHGFVPFIGPAVSYENLNFQESFEDNLTHDLAENKLGYGITFGWDIRPNRLQTWILRTNLRWYPNLQLDMNNNESISFNNIEFNFIQLVVYPSRMINKNKLISKP